MLKFVAGSAVVIALILSIRMYRPDSESTDSRRSEVPVSPTPGALSASSASTAASAPVASPIVGEAAGDAPEPAMEAARAERSETSAAATGGAAERADGIADGWTESGRSTENPVAETLRRVGEDPDYASDLFAMYQHLESADARRGVAARITAIAALSDAGERTESQLVSNVLETQGAEQQRWAELLREVGVRSPASRQMLMDAIPLVGEGDILESVLAAMLPAESDVDDRALVLSHLEAFVEHDDPAVRAAAIRGVSMWGTQDHVATLESGLRDPSNDVRHAAAAAAMMSDLRSDDVKRGLLMILADESEAPDTREQAYYALANYRLGDQERHLVEHWVQDRIDAADGEF